MKTSFKILLLLIAAVCFAESDITGIWYQIAIYKEGFYQGNSWSDTMYDDTIPYMMKVDNNTCRAYAIFDERIYYQKSPYTITDDSLFSDSLHFWTGVGSDPLGWSRNGDTLFITFYYEELPYYEIVKIIFLQVNEFRFPDNWPSSDTLWKPSELTPFGTWSFGSGPDDMPLHVNKTVYKKSTGLTCDANKHFQLNGRLSKKTTRVSAGMVVSNHNFHNISFGKNVLNGYKVKSLEKRHYKP